MANWCSNYLTVTGGSEEDTKEFFECFINMSEKGQAEGLGQFPEELLSENLDEVYLFEIYCEEGHQDYIFFETKWAPPIQLVVAIGKKFKVSFEMEYDESGNQIYGKLTYNFEKDNFRDVYLDDSDFDEFEYINEEDMYKFRDNLWESDGDIKKLLLEEKIKKGKEIWSI